MRVCCAEHKAQSLILLASFAGMPPCRYQSHGLGKEGRKNGSFMAGQGCHSNPGIQPTAATPVHAGCQAASASLCLTLPLALFHTRPSRRWSLTSLQQRAGECRPLPLSNPRLFRLKARCMELASNVVHHAVDVL